MKYILFIFFLPLCLISQTHYIDQHNMYMFGDVIENDISINTYYNSLDSCDISWSIIKDSMPSQWEFSICFPDCYPIGVVNQQNLFMPNENNYLNCHIYPNGQVGNGIVQMQIVTNNSYIDTVTWNGVISSTANIDLINASSVRSKQLIKVYNILGKPSKIVKNKMLYFIYEDGRVEKKMIL